MGVGFDRLRLWVYDPKKTQILHRRTPPFTHSHRPPSGLTFGIIQFRGSGPPVSCRPHEPTAALNPRECRLIIATSEQMIPGRGQAFSDFRSTDTLACQLLRSDGSRAESAPAFGYRSTASLPPKADASRGQRFSDFPHLYTRSGAIRVPMAGKIFPEHLRTEPRTGQAKLIVTMAVPSALVAVSASARWDGDTRL